MAFHFATDTFNIGIIRTILISLAALTVPHMVLIDASVAFKKKFKPAK